MVQIALEFLDGEAGVNVRLLLWFVFRDGDGYLS